MNARTIFADKKLQFDEKTLNEIIKQTNEKVDKILKFFNWKRDDFLKLENNDALELENEEEDEELFPESCNTTKNSVKLDESALSSLLNKNEVEVPQKFSDLQTKFTREEKLLIYEYVAKQASTPTKQQNSFLLEQEQKFAEMVTTLKREKKRRRKYRTMKPTYMEELRSVLDMQMQALERCHEEHKRKRRRNSPSRKRQHKKVGNKNLC